MTGTATVEDKLALFDVTVIVRTVESPPVFRVAFAVPVASVVPFVITTAPEVAAKVTGMPANALLAPSRANVDIVADVEPSLSRKGRLLFVVNDATAVVAPAEPVTTGTLTVAVRPPTVDVMVIVRSVESPAVVKVACAIPVASVVPLVITTAPDVAAKVTGTPANALLAESRANVDMVAVVEPSLSKNGRLLLVVNDTTAGIAAAEPLTTGTLTVAVRLPTVAVTVMVLIVGSPAVESVATAAPVASVVALVTATPPESAANVTTTPDIRLLVEFRAKTVIVVGVDPSDGIDARLDVAVIEAGTTGVVVVPVPVVPVPVVPVPVVPVPVVPVAVVSALFNPVELPPQAVSSAAPIKATMTNLRINKFPCLPGTASALSKDWNLHAVSLA